ncbi:MAG: hypothetical protein EKK40_08075 [Bradyrhizobiaceae bacterium]|nr:MAG: hypothetical protein EKK40_08075 [Bradyrhizobiaceae bacterium]
MIKLLADFGAAGRAKGEVDALDKSLDNLGKTSGNTDRVARSIKDVADAAKGLASAGWSKGFTADIDKLGLGADKIAKLKHEYQDLFATLRGQRASFALPKLDAWEKSTIASLKKVKQETAASGRSSLPGVFALGRRALGPLALGFTAFETIKSAIKASADNQRERFREELAGMTPGEVSESAKTAALLTQKYRNVGQQDIMTQMRKLRSTLGDFHHAREMIESIVQAQAVLSSGPGGKDGAVRDLDQITKGLEGAGLASDPAKFGRMLNAFVKGKNLFGETLTGEDFRTYIRNSNSSKYGLSEDYLAGVVPTMIQHEGASKFATSQMSAFNALIGDHMTQAARAQLRKMGIFSDTNELVDKKLFETDPDQWVAKNLKGRLASAGAKLGPDATDEERARTVDLLTKMFSNRQVAEFFASIAANLPIIEKDRANLKNAAGLDAAGRTTGKDTYQSWEAIKTQTANLAQNIIADGGKIAAAMNGVATAIGWAADMVKGDYKDRVDKDSKAMFDSRSFAGVPEGIAGGLPLTEAEQRRAEEAERARLRDNANLPPANPWEAVTNAAAGEVGSATGSSFRENLKSELDAAKADVSSAVQEMKGMLNFSASPTITPNISAPSGSGVPGKQSSIADTSRRLARLIDHHDIGNFADRDFA